MAEDGTSALTAVSRTAFVVNTGANANLGAPVPEPSTSVTAEIPAVPAGPGYGVLLPDGSIWYPGSRKRLPAPLLLRVVVWILALATLLASAAVFVIHYHPAWANPFRHVVTTAGTRSAGGGTTAPTTPATGSVGASKFKLLNPQPAGLQAGNSAYRVPASYSVVVTETIPGHQAWVAAWKATNGQWSGSPVQQQTLGVNGIEKMTIPGNGEMRLQVAAVGASVQVLKGTKVVGTVTEHSPWVWWFVPAGSSFHHSA